MSNYWTKRFELEELRRTNEAIKYIYQIDKQYDKSLAEIDKKINYWYTKMAKNNEISINEAKKLLTKNELQEFKWTVEEYIAKGIENNVNGAWLKQLQNASAKVHISKLEALKIQIQNDIENMYQGLDVGMDKYLKRIYSDTYYHTAFDIGQGLGSINASFSKLDKNKLNQVIYKPWAKDGIDFSGRIWKDKTDLVNSLHTGITQHIISGGNIEDVIEDVTKFVNDKIKNKKAAAARLVRTETAAYASKAQKEVYRELEVDKYEIVATLDTHTSDICQNFDGKVFDMKDYEVGVTAPPFHCNCRTVTVPWFPPDIDKGERAARNKDGEVIYVPQDMKYSEWYEKYISDNQNNETISLKNNENNDNIKSKEFKKINGKHSFEEDLKNTNPYYDKNKNYKTNCQRCVNAYEARRRGFDVIAKPFSNDSLSKMFHGQGWPNVYKDYELIDCSSISSIEPVDMIEHLMSTWGDGARAIIRVVWKNYSSGHVFVAEQISGKTIFLDPQTGVKDVKYYFKEAKKTGTYIMRVDNLEFTNLIDRCCEEVD